jgi:flavin-dependent dehydrogenase
LTSSMVDLLVAGGGPIGLATALYAERAGLSVVVAEPRQQPVDKACGEGLMPAAVAALADLGVQPEGRPFAGIRYTSDRHTAEARFRSGHGLGVRRTTLQSCLAAAVAERGIPVIVNAIDDVAQYDGGVSCDGVDARYLAAADGLHSPIRRNLGLDGERASQQRFGLRRHFAVAPWTSLVEVHWGSHVEAYVTPIDDGLVGVALLTSRREPFEVQLGAFPKLQARLPSEACTITRGAGPLRQRSRARVAGRVLLVGDASGYVDALTGEGIAVGISSARALVEAVVNDDPSSYERAWLRASRRYRWITESLLWARNRRVTAGAIVPGAQRLPWLFSAAVNQLAR